MKYKRKPYRFRQKKSIFKNRFFWLGFFVLAISGGIFYFLFFSSFFKIKETKIFGNQKIPLASIQQIVQDILSDKKNNFLIMSLFGKKDISEKILASFPQAAEVWSKMKFPESLTIEIEERKPAAIFCQSDRQFFLDKTGVIFEEVSETDFPFPKIKKENPPQEVRLGDKIIEPELMSQILVIESRVKNDFKLPLEEILLVSEERLNAKISGGWEIYFDPAANIEWQLTKLGALLEKEIPFEKRKDLEYVDLRFGNFAPYKFRQLDVIDKN